MKINFKQLILKALLAGSFIAVAGWAFLRCENRVVGAILFSIGLIAVILLQTNLYTGKVGYINSKQKLVEALIILVVNCAAAAGVGLVYKMVYGAISFQSRLDKSWYQLLIDGIGCGIMIYLAVELYSKTHNLFTIVLPVVVFILSGFEHSIADTFYLAASNPTWQGVVDILIIICGNSIGSLLVRRIQLWAE